jgi:hypothetical protein
MAFAMDREKHLIEVPLVTRLGASTLPLLGVVLPKLQTPLADGFIGDIDTACKEERLHVAIAERKARREPDSMPDDLTGTAVIFVTCKVSGWSHVSCLSWDSMDH